MHFAIILQLFISLLTLPSPALSVSKSQKPPGKDAILLSQVHSLTLRGDRRTSGRRASPVPQLKCVGPSKRICNMYEVDSMRCTNSGFGYDEEDVQWTCTASLPGEFKLGSTDVICEGYRNADDPWVLKGSCGVEYRLLLTDLGEQRFGHESFDEDQWWRHKRPGRFSRSLTWLGNLLFFGIFFGVFGLVIWSMIRDCLGRGGNQGGPRVRWGWGGGWDGGDGWGGGGGGGGPYPGPPPPYSSSYQSGQGWRPGFWTGALAGGGVGYGLGRRNDRYGSPFGGRRRRDGYGSGEGSSSSSRFSTPSTSTGFGSTSRR